MKRHLKCRIMGKRRMHPSVSKLHDMPQSLQLIELKSIDNIMMELDLIQSKQLHGQNMNRLERRPESR
jgi:hypothetical protein